MSDGICSRRRTVGAVPASVKPSVTGKAVPHFSGASGSRSITYLPRATLMIGAPGILLLEGENHSYMLLGSYNVPNPSLQITIVGRHNVHAMLDYSIHQAVICICALVVTSDSFEPGVFGNTQCKSIFLAQFLQFGKHAVGDDRNAFSIQTVHHGRNDLELVLDGVGNEVGVDKHRIRGGESCVVLEEKRRRSLRPVKISAV